MPSTPLTDAIVALTTYANTVTGESDTTLSAAVETLIDGYGGGSVPNFLDPKQQIGTMAVDAENTIAVKTALSGVPAGTTVIAFCPSAPAFKIMLLYKRANDNVSIATGFSSDYAQAQYNKSTWSHSALAVGDVYYLFTGNNF